MAASPRYLKDLMEEISKEIQESHLFIVKMSESVQERRNAVEKHCDQCRHLFKPWPSKVVQLDVPEIQSDDRRGGLDEKPESGLFYLESVKEQEELAMLDDILAKAQHARDIQNKMPSGPKKKCNSAKLSSSNLSTRQVKETKTKPKVSYPVPKKTPSAKSTYTATYTKPTTHKAGPHNTSSYRKTIAPSQQGRRKQTGQKQTSGLESRETKEPCEEAPSKLTATPRSSEDTISTTSKPGKDINIYNRVKPTSESQFLISLKGSTLTMPTEYDEICKEHKKLFRRIQKARTCTSSKGEEQFVKRLEETFCPELLSLPSFVELETEAVRVEKEFKEILGFVKGNFSVIHQTRKTSQVNVKYNFQEGWETVISKFKKLNQEAQILEESLDFVSNCCSLPEHKLLFGEKEGTTTEQLSSHFTRGKFSKTDGDGCFTYRNLKELQTFLKLSYDYKIMKYKLDLRNMLSERILPLLRQLPTSHKSFVPLCRSVYSILCCEGKTFPAVVKDSLPEEECYGT